MCVYVCVCVCVCVSLQATGFTGWAVCKPHCLAAELATLHVILLHHLLHSPAPADDHGRPPSHHLLSLKRFAILAAQRLAVLPPFARLFSGARILCRQGDPQANAPAEQSLAAGTVNAGKACTKLAGTCSSRCTPVRHPSASCASSSNASGLGELRCMLARRTTGKERAPLRVPSIS